MRVCRFGIAEAEEFKRTRRLDHHRHEHELPASAEALVASGRFRWVGDKRRAIMPLLSGTGPGYDKASHSDDKELAWGRKKSLFGCVTQQLLPRGGANPKGVQPASRPWTFAPNQTTSPRLHQDRNSKPSESTCNQEGSAE